MGTQAGWLLPIAVIGGLGALYATRLRPSRRLAAIGLFGSWAAIDGYVISITKGLTHPYYLAPLGPAVWLTGSIANGMNAALPYAVPFADEGGGPAEQQPGGGVPNGGFQFPNSDLAALARFLKSHRAERPMGATTDVMVPSAAAAEGLIIRFGIAAVPVGGFVGSDPIISAEQLQARVKAKAVRFFLLPTNGFAGRFGGGGFGGGGFGGGGSNTGGGTTAGPGLGPLLPAAATTRPSRGGRGRRGDGFAGGFTTSATEFVATSCAVVDQAKWKGTTSTTMPIQTFRGGPSAAPFTLYDCA